MRIIFVRHATTEWNKLKRIQGQTDIPLSQQGKIEARKLRDDLAQTKIDYIICSDLLRAFETALIISEGHTTVPIQDTGLRECSFGVIEGLTKQMACERYGNEILEHWEDQHLQYDFTLYGGENRNIVLDRHKRVFEKLKEDNPDRTILVVGHGRGLSTFLGELGYPIGMKHGESMIIDY